MQRILGTGGYGFIGSHLCEPLVEAEHDVLCVDNFFTSSLANVLPLLVYLRFELMRHEVTFPLNVEVEQTKNLAYPASLVHYQFDPVQTIMTSVHGAINMLGLAKCLNLCLFLDSTSEAHGDPEVHPQPESYWGLIRTRINGWVFNEMTPEVLADGIRKVYSWKTAAMQNAQRGCIGLASGCRAAIYAAAHYTSVKLLFPSPTHGSGD